VVVEVLVTLTQVQAVVVVLVMEVKMVLRPQVLLRTLAQAEVACEVMMHTQQALAVRVL
jgi:hypothetical protein